MTFSTTYTFDDSGDFNFNSSKMEVASGAARLILESNPSQVLSQDFANDTGFTYNGSEVEFAAGVARQLSQTPSDSILGANFSSSLDANWTTFGNETHTAVGAPVLTSGQLDCPLGSNGIYYEDAAIGNLGQKGAMKCKFTPDYSGGPAAIKNILGLFPAVGNNGKILLLHTSSGTTIRVTAHNSAGAAIVTAATFGVWSPVAGTEYTFEMLWDYDDYGIRLYIDGAQVGGDIDVGGATRGTNSTRFYIGAAPTYNSADGFFDDVLLLTEDTQDENYSVPNNVYTESEVELPAFSYSGLGAVQSYDSLSVTEVGSPRYTIDGQYHDGADWVASDGSYAQANTLAQVNADIASIAPTDDPDFSVVFPDGATQNSVDDLQLTYTGQIYPSDDPNIKPNTSIQTDQLISVSETVTKPAGTDIQYIVNFGGQDMYFDGAAWVNSDCSLAQSNTVADINSNVGSLDLSAGGSFHVKSVLNSDGTATPEIDSFQLTYSFFVAEPSDVDECMVYSYLSDILQDGVDIATLAPVLHVNIRRAFSVGDKTFLPQTIDIAYDTNGYAEIQLAQTENVGAKLEFSISLTENNTKRIVRFTPVVIPNSSDINLTALTSPIDAQT